MSRATPMNLAKLNVALALFNLAMGLWLCVMAAQNYQNAQANLRNAQRNLELARGLCDSGRHAQRGDPSGAPSEGCQSGGAAASPTLSSRNPETPNDR